MSARAPDAELRRAAANLDLIRGQMDALARQAETLQVAFEEVARARETLRLAQQAGAGREILVPIGGNGFLFGQVKDADKVIVGIGSDVAIEQTVAGALERLETRSRAIEEAERGLAERMAQLEQQADAYNERVQELYDQSQGGSPG